MVIAKPRLKVMNEDPTTPQPDVEPEVVTEEAEDQAATVLDGSKLMRIASMTKAMLIEAREAQLDEPGRNRLSQIYDRSITELCSVLPEELRDELSEVFVPLDSDPVPSTSELRIAQAQLVGWLEGLFNGIQAALLTQQMAARAQLEQIRRPQALGPGEEESFPGVYL